jgi:hypothetical protein
MAAFKHLFAGLLCVLLAMMTGVGSAGAHGLAENRATFVLRDQNHVSVTLFITFSEALHRVLAPERSFQEFVLAHAAMPPEIFKSALFEAERSFQAETQAQTADGHRLLFERWIWPDPATVQLALRERAMQALVAPNDHAHEAALEVRAECQSAKAIHSVRATFPAAFARVLVVSYQPKQVWVEPLRASPEITF